MDKYGKRLHDCPWGGNDTIPGFWFHDDRVGDAVKENVLDQDHWMKSSSWGPQGKKGQKGIFGGK